MVGLQLERGAQRDLVARLGEAVRFRRFRREAGDELAHGGLAYRAEEAVDDLAVAQRVDGRDGLHLEGRGGLGVLVDVDLDELDRARGLVDDGLEDGAESPAGSTPGRPEVDDDG